VPIVETWIEETTPGIDPIPFKVWLAHQPESEQQRFIWLELEMMKQKNKANVRMMNA
jgi:hypothetical protein